MGEIQTPKGRRLDGIQALRGLAAFLVVLMHLMFGAEAGNNKYAIVAAGLMPHLGNFGVDIFFVISGFIIALQVERGDSPFAFGFRRAVRIYPVFWVALASCIAIRTWAGWPAHLSGLLQSPSQLLLMDYARDLDVSWTLPYEVQFYIAASIILAFGGLSRKALVAWMLIEWMLVGAANAGLIPNVPIFHSLSLEFLLGIGLGYGYHHFKIPMPKLAIPLALFVVGIASYSMGWKAFYGNAFGRPFVAGGCATIVVLSVLCMEERGLKFPKASVFLGDISYSLYLWHLPVIIVMQTLWAPILVRTYIFPLFLHCHHRERDCGFICKLCGIGTPS